MIPLEQAQNYVLEHISTLRAIAAPIDECLGLCTSEPLHSQETIPPFDNTAVDGFALRSADLNSLSESPQMDVKVVGTIAAGDGLRHISEAGTAYRIMTGAMLPEGADAVVMVEDVEECGDSVRLSQVVKAGDNVRRAGTDISKGSLLFPAHSILGPAHIGVLASVGYARVPVFQRPRIGVVSTGSELIDGPGPLAPGQIRDSNRHSLRAVLSTLSVDVVDLGVIVDDEVQLREGFIGAAKQMDAIVSSGGVSVGDFDYTKKILDEVSGGEMRWMQVAIRPAKPFAFGLINGTPFFGLPGNPVSALVSFELFVRPALRKMLGNTNLMDPQLRALARNDYNRQNDGKTHFVRARLTTDPNGQLEVWPLDKQSSHMLHEMSKANALIVVPDGKGFMAGEHVMVKQTSAIE